MTQNAFAVVDLFAGPGGLAEGFSSFRADDGSQPFRVVMSVEKDPIAHRTLRLRSFLRQFNGGFPDAYYQWIEQAGDEPDWEYLYPVQWRAACEEAQNVTMGVDEDDAAIASRLTAIRRRHGDQTIVIGGPPCQAYSLVGRSRNKGKVDYVFEDDHRHELYKAYVDVLKRLRPAAFVMENVKGLLSSKTNGDFLFHRVLADLRQPSGKSSGYRLISLAAGGSAGIDPAPSDFVIRAEKHGIPQARHRLFIIGLREDIAPELDDNCIMSAQLKEEHGATVRHVLAGLAKVRSGISRRDDDADEWTAVVNATFADLGRVRLTGPVSETTKFREALQRAMTALRSTKTPRRRSDRSLATAESSCPPGLLKWLEDPRLTALPNHETRTHMPTDLSRYAFAAVFGDAFGRSPRADEFPRELAPEHANWQTGNFVDRFKVQIWDAPSSTVTSHISKDGHYYIHPDAAQCRSLTVREAARLQTFPDNYVFLGNRTQQYVQVGNAVPPLLACKIAEALYRLFNRNLEAAS